MTDTSCDSRRPLAATAAPLHLSLVILAPPRGASGPDPPPSGLATAVPAAATTCAAILDLELVERERVAGWRGDAWRACAAARVVGLREEGPGWLAGWMTADAAALFVSKCRWAG
jgi:hypothetical protein